MKKNNKGFKCCDCDCYIIPPQIYDTEKVKLCRCDEVSVERSKSDVKPSPVAIAVTECIQRQAVQDEARAPFTPAKVPMFVPVKQEATVPIFRRLAGVLSSALAV